MINAFLVGIFFNALVSGIVAFAAILLVFFLFSRWKNINDINRAYAWFWFFTMLTWLTISIRYFAISFGYAGAGIYIGDIIVEGTIFFTGPPLFYYLSLRLFKDSWQKIFFPVFSTILAFVAFYFLLLPGGVSEVHMTDFSADVSINDISLGIFSSQIALIIIFIFYDILMYILKRNKNNNNRTFYQLLYSIPLLIYVVLGAIDQAKIILDWPLVVFRVLYASSFLFAYMIISQDEIRREKYFLKNGAVINTAEGV